MTKYYEVHPIQDDQGTVGKMLIKEGEIIAVMPSNSVPGQNSSITLDGFDPTEDLIALADTYEDIRLLIDPPKLKLNTPPGGSHG